jgi:hypothetical protein
MYLEDGTSKPVFLSRRMRGYNYLVTSVWLPLDYNSGNRFTLSPIRLNRGSVHRAGQLRSRAASSTPCNRLIFCAGVKETDLGPFAEKPVGKMPIALFPWNAGRRTPGHRQLPARGQEYRPGAVSHYDED